MKFRELLNTNQNDLEKIYIYFDEDQWDNAMPEIAVRDIRDIPNADYILKLTVDAWFVDTNFNLHVLV